MRKRLSVEQVSAIDAAKSYDDDKRMNLECRLGRVVSDWDCYVIKDGSYNPSYFARVAFFVARLVSRYR